ncbi:MAG: 4Fe-4S dicluster domain-containing protein [Candidatus Hodarchaeota archaeon]
MQAILTKQIRENTMKWGADLVGFAPVERFNRYILDNRPTASLPQARTVIVLGLQMVDPLLDLWLHAPPSTGAGRYTMGRVFEDEILRAICYRLALFMYKNGIEAKVLPYGPDAEEDQQGFLYLKEAGVLAGLGVIGKNNLLINPTYGPRIRLRAVAITVDLPSSRVMTENPWCNDCDRCIRACPVNALEGGKYNREKCLTSPLHRRKLSPATELWCTRCATVCPVGASVPSDDNLRIKVS